MINQSNARGIKSISKMILTAVIAFVVIFCVFATTSFAGLLSQYNVEIQIDNDSVVVTTNETEPIEILSQANIQLAESDKLDITGFDAGKGGVIKIDRLNNIHIEFDGKISTYGVYADNVADALSEIGIDAGEQSQMNYEPTDYIVDGMVINILSAKHVTLVVDGTSNQYAMYQGTVKDLLDLAQITLGENDYTEPALDTSLNEDMTVTVCRVEIKQDVKKVAVAYSTTKQNDSSLASGTQKVATKGVNGEAEVTYDVKYVNGEEVERTEISRTTTKAPVNEVIKVGTKSVSTTSTGSSSGASYSNVALQYSARYNVSSNPLTSYKGVVYYNGHRETYYSQRVLPGYGLNIPGRHVADDGTVRDGDGYICVAANTSYMSKGTTLMTSLGPAKVYDCGCAYGTIDIYVNW